MTGLARGDWINQYHAELKTPSGQYVVYNGSLQK